MPEQRFERGAVYHRDFVLGKNERIDEEKRTIELAFSSEVEAERWGFIEILDHSPGSVRMDAINGGAPLLVDHDARIHVGTVEAARIDTDRKGRAVVRYGSVGRAAEEFQLAVDGIRQKVSVGYRIHDYEESRESKDGPVVVRVTDWEPIEISIVSMPLDDTVGIGRGAESVIPGQEKQTMTDQVVDTQDVTDGGETRETEVRVEIRDNSKESTAAEKKRVSTMLDVADLYPNNRELASFARKCIKDNTPLEDFHARVHEFTSPKPSETPKIEDAPATELGMERKEAERFSLFRAIRAIAAAKEGGPAFRHAAPFEYECSTAIEDQLDRESRGFFVPYDVQRAGLWMDPVKLARRHAQMGLRAAPLDTSENDDLVATDHMAGSFIPALRASSVLFGLGARQMTGLVGNVDIPRTDTPATFGWIAEDGDSADSDIVTGTVPLTPKTVSGSVPITRRLRKQSSPDVEMMVREDLITGAALAVDLGGLAGSGAANQPTGVLNTSGIGTVTIAAAGNPTYAEIVEFETDVATANGLMGTLAYITTAGVRGNGKVRTKDSGSGRFVIEDNMANGYPVVISTQLAANTIMFGNWEEVLIGMWGVLDIRVDTATNAAKDRVTLRAFQDVDVAVRHAASFSKNA